MVFDNIFAYKKISTFQATVNDLNVHKASPDEMVCDDSQIATLTSYSCIPS